MWNFFLFLFDKMHSVYERVDAFLLFTGAKLEFSSGFPVHGQVAK